MSTPGTPSREAVMLRTMSERSIPIIAQKAAEHIVGQLEPRFNEAYKAGKAGSFKDFLLISTYGAPYTYHFHIINMDWFNKNGLVQLVDVIDILAASRSIIENLLVERYGIKTMINILNGGESDFDFDWYALLIFPPRKKRLSIRRLRRLWRR